MLLAVHITVERNYFLRLFHRHGYDPKGSHGACFCPTHPRRWNIFQRPTLHYLAKLLELKRFTVLGFRCSPITVERQHFPPMTVEHFLGHTPTGPLSHTDVLPRWVLAKSPPRQNISTQTHDDGTFPRHFFTSPFDLTFHRHGHDRQHDHHHARRR